MEIVEVRFDDGGVPTLCGSEGLTLQRGDRVAAESKRGVDVAVVLSAPRTGCAPQAPDPLPRVLRLIGPADESVMARNSVTESQISAMVTQRVRAHDLPMRVLRVSLPLEGSQVTVYFSADTRIDFRELVKEVSQHLRTKVHLLQIGARDQAKMVGGIGTCGRQLCCSAFMTEFAPISMKMAKDQSLFLNPLKFSGSCGKLMCCLRYEHETYREARGRLPREGAVVVTPGGEGVVIETNIVRESVVVEMRSSGARLPFPASEVQVVAGPRRGAHPPPTAAAGEDE